MLWPNVTHPRHRPANFWHIHAHAHIPIKHIRKQIAQKTFVTPSRHKINVSLQHWSSSSTLHNFFRSTTSFLVAMIHPWNVYEERFRTFAFAFLNQQ
jgi:hypothetical protein